MRLGMTDRSIPFDIPTIETDRLILRAHTLDDFEDCAAMWGDEAVTRHIGGQPFAPGDVWARLLRYTGHWAHLGYGFWAIEDRQSGKFAGECGFADFKRDLVPSLDGMPEIGWALAVWAQGRGVATEAIRAAVEWGDAHFDAGTRTSCMIDPDNLASIRVAEKCGYEEFARTEYRGTPTILYRR